MAHPIPDRNAGLAPRDVSSLYGPHRTEMETHTTFETYLFCCCVALNYNDQVAHMFSLSRRPRKGVYYEFVRAKRRDKTRVI